MFFIFWLFQDKDQSVKMGIINSDNTDNKDEGEAKVEGSIEVFVQEFYFKIKA